MEFSRIISCFIEGEIKMAQIRKIGGNRQKFDKYGLNKLINCNFIDRKRQLLPKTLCKSGKVCIMGMISSLSIELSEKLQNIKYKFQKGG